MTKTLVNKKEIETLLSEFKEKVKYIKQMKKSQGILIICHYSVWCK